MWMAKGYSNQNGLKLIKMDFEKGLNWPEMVKMILTLSYNCIKRSKMCQKLVKTDPKKKSKHVKNGQSVVKNVLRYCAYCVDMVIMK